MTDTLIDDVRALAERAVRHLNYHGWDAPLRYVREEGYSDATIVAVDVMGDTLPRCGIRQDRSDLEGVLDLLRAALGRKAADDSELDKEVSRDLVAELLTGIARMPQEEIAQALRPVDAH